MNASRASNRLQHSLPGLIRSIQMSRVSLHAFVEGKSHDPYFYARLCAEELQGQISYRIIRSDEVYGANALGGKPALLKLHALLRRRQRLRSFDQAHPYSVVFFLDKDVEDILRTRRRCPHVVYTPTYDLEGLLFRHGDLVDAVASECSLDPAEVAPVLAGWQPAATQRWRRWVTLCLLTQVAKVHSEANYGSPSRVNDMPMGEVDGRAVRAKLAAIHRASGLTQQQFDALVARVDRQVSLRYERGDADTIFKGKWFPDLLHETMTQRFPTEIARVGSFKDRVLSGLSRSLDFAAPWSEHFRAPLRLIAS